MENKEDKYLIEAKVYLDTVREELHIECPVCRKDLKNKKLYTYHKCSEKKVIKNKEDKCLICGKGGILWRNEKDYRTLILLCNECVDKPRKEVENAILEYTKNIGIIEE